MPNHQSQVGILINFMIVGIVGMSPTLDLNVIYTNDELRTDHQQEKTLGSCCL